MGDVFLPDSSCMVAVLSAGHVHHAPAARELNGRLDRGETMVVAAPALVETYCVLTRLPEPHRVPAVHALEVIDAGFVRGRRVVALDGDDYVTLLRHAPAQGIMGGRVYDAVIAACARRAGVDVVLTFHERHFLQFAGHGLAVAVPQRA